MVTGLWSVLFPSLRHADRLTAEALRKARRRSLLDDLEPASSK